VADIIDIVKNPGNAGRIIWNKKDSDNLLDFNESETSYFVRVTTSDAENAKAAAAKLFDGAEFITMGAAGESGEIAFTTGIAKEGALAAAVEELKKSSAVKGIANMIRIVD
jgi:hypothetical protein